MHFAFGSGLPKIFPYTLSTPASPITFLMEDPQLPVRGLAGLITLAAAVLY